MNPTDVLVIGAGPTGLTLAVDLARRGVALRVLDAAPGPVRASKGKGLQPRTQEVFEDLGVLDEILAAGGPYPTVRAYRGDQVVWEGGIADPRDPTPDVPYPSVTILPQWRTEEILRARLAALGVVVEYGSAVTGLSQDVDGVTVRLDDDRTASSRYLVGADGGRSAVRRAVDVRLVGETRESERMAIADVRLPPGVLDREHWHFWGDTADPTTVVGLCPLRGTDAYQLTAPLAEDDVPDLTLAGLRQLLAERSGRSDLPILDVDWTSIYRVNIRMATRFRVGRVLLAGDAVHVHAPAGGQGLNTGVQDAYNLGWKLAGVLAGADDALLDTYEAERLPVAAEVLGLSTALLGQQLAGDRVEGVPRRGRDTDQLDLHYQDGPLSIDARAAAGTGPLRAGDRAPDAPLVDVWGAPSRLFAALRGPQATVLVFPPARGVDVVLPDVAGVAVLTIVNNASSNGDYFDRLGHAAEGFGIDPVAGGLAVVRPDGYVGLLADADRPDAVADYLSGTLRLARAVERA